MCTKWQCVWTRGGGKSPWGSHKVKKKKSNKNIFYTHQVSSKYEMQEILRKPN